MNVNFLSKLSTCAPCERRNKSTRIIKIQPLELNFTFELDKQSTCAIKVTNVSDLDHVAFKVRTTTLPVNCCVYPNIGLIKPKSTCNLTVIIQAQRCEDKFLILSKIVPFQTNQDDVTLDMFADESISYTEESMLWVVPVPPLSQAHSPLLNFTINIDRLLAKLDSLEAEFNTSKPKEEGCTTTQVNVKSMGEMTISEFVRVWGWKILFPWIVIFVSTMSGLIYVLHLRH